MGDMGEYWRDVKPFLKERARQKREKNKESSTEILIKHGVAFESKNEGIHLIVRHASKIVDFWPSTGRFICRSGKRDDHGVFNLLKYLKVNGK